MTGATYDPAVFWEDRHQRLGDLRSGGHASMSEVDNRRFYFRRLALLVDAIGDRGSEQVPLRVLDAGCGRGWFVEQLRVLGYDVDGVDVSPSALESARERVPGANLELCSLDDVSVRRTYDVVYAVDVLFHLVDDGLWERSLRRLATCTSIGGMLIVSDAPVEEPFMPGDYVRYRPRAMYDEVLAEHGLAHRRTLPYDFRQTVGGFHVYGNPAGRSSS